VNRKLIIIKTRDGLYVETDQYQTLSEALKGEKIADDNVRSFKVLCCCEQCELDREQAK
jgi:hypothetical protein